MNPFEPPAAPIVGEVAATVADRRAAGKGDTYRPRPRWPSMQQLEYVQKFATAGLLAIGFLFLILHGLVDPGNAVRLLARGARKQAGMA